MHRRGVDREVDARDRRERGREAVHVVEQVERVRDPDQPEERDRDAEHVVGDELDAETGGDREPRGGELGGELRARAQVTKVVDQAREEDDRAAAEDPGELPGGLDRADRECEEHADEEAGTHRTPPNVGVARGMPALSGRLRNELGGSGRGAKQRPQGERRDGQGGDRDDRVHRCGKGSGPPGSAPILSALVRASAISGTTTLSVCCLTRGPTARVAAQLALLRGVADEIVVGLDTSVAADLAHPLVEVADVLEHYPYVDPVDRPVGWIHCALHAVSGSSGWTTTRFPRPHSSTRCVT